MITTFQRLMPWERTNHKNSCFFWPYHSALNLSVNSTAEMGDLKCFELHQYIRLATVVFLVMFDRTCYCKYTLFMLIILCMKALPKGYVILLQYNNQLVLRQTSFFRVWLLLKKTAYPPLTFMFCLY